MSEIESREARRLALQRSIDAAKSHESRNALGQFSTPFPLALDIMRRVRELLPRSGAASILEPALGTGVFLSAFAEAFGHAPRRTLGFDIDADYCEAARRVWRGCDAEIRRADFLSAAPDECFDLIVTNPPYSRHHHIDAATKARLQRDVLAETGLRLSGLAGLYCHFMLLSAKWLKPDGLSCWLVPCEFMDVNYGAAVKRFLSERVELLQIHRFRPDDLQFADALVSSCVVIFRNRPPDPSRGAVHTVRLTTGGSVCQPDRSRTVPLADLDPDAKWTPLFDSDATRRTDTATLGDFFTVKRGIATGDNSFFILGADEAARREIPRRFLRPVLPSPRYVKGERIASNDGLPALDRLQFLFSCDLDEATLRRDFPVVWRYVREGAERGVAEGYICSRRTPWYSCEQRERAPIVVPYMGRGAADGRLFRFILNESEAIATNVYLMLYPRPQYAAALNDVATLEAVWRSLNAIAPETLVSGGRTYGGGLHKLEPRELMHTPCALPPDFLSPTLCQPALFALTA